MKSIIKQCVAFSLIALSTFAWADTPTPNAQCSKLQGTNWVVTGWIDGPQKLMGTVNFGPGQPFNDSLMLFYSMNVVPGSSNLKLLGIDQINCYEQDNNKIRILIQHVSYSLGNGSAQDIDNCDISGLDPNTKEISYGSADCSSTDMQGLVFIKR